MNKSERSRSEQPGHLWPQPWQTTAALKETNINWQLILLIHSEHFISFSFVMWNDVRWNLDRSGLRVRQGSTRRDFMLLIHNQHTLTQEVNAHTTELDGFDNVSRKFDWSIRLSVNLFHSMRWFGQDNECLKLGDMLEVSCWQPLLMHASVDFVVVQLASEV